MAEYVHDTVVLLVQPAEVDGPEVDGPQAVADLLEADVLALQEVAYEDLLVLPADRLVLRDEANLEMGRIGNVHRPSGEWAGGGTIDGGRGLEVQGFVGSLLVEDVAEGIEAALLCAEVLLRGTGGLGLEGAMHAFVPSVLMGAGRLDELGADAEFDPVDGELGETGDGGGGEGDSVVALDDVGKAEESEEPIKAPAGVVLVDPEHALAVQEEATESVLNGEGVAELSVPGPELPLEVHGPNGIGAIHGSGGRTRMGSSAPGFAGFHQPGTPKDVVNGIHGGDRLEFLGNHLPELPRTPATMSSELLETGYDLRRRGVRAGPRPVGTVLEALEAFCLISLDPLVARGSADPVATAEFADGVEALLGLQNETDSLIHDACTSPRHRGILREGKPLRCGENCKPSAPNVL
jgi:hypothetical protein